MVFRNTIFLIVVILVSTFFLFLTQLYNIAHEEGALGSENSALAKFSRRIFPQPEKVTEVEKAAPVIVKKISIREKKKRFRELLVPAVEQVYIELDDEFNRVAKALLTGDLTKRIDALKREYKVKSDQDLLAALKPHPRSVALAQAALESSWGTSRFFTQANNVFGVWSFNKNEPRIAAGEQRGSKTIWLKKYLSIYSSVKDYYRVLARGYAYKEFRDLRILSDNPFELVAKLNSYSEKGAVYGHELASVISYNKFGLYDANYYEIQAVSQEYSALENSVIDNSTEKSEISSNSAIEKAAQEAGVVNYSVMSSVVFDNTPARSSEVFDQSNNNVTKTVLDSAAREIGITAVASETVVSKAGNYAEPSY